MVLLKCKLNCARIGFVNRVDVYLYGSWSHHVDDTLWVDDIHTPPNTPPGCYIHITSLLFRYDKWRL